MAGISAAKMKRRDLEDVNDDFSDFSLSAPARKIRRLNAGLSPIVEEEEPAVPLVFQQPMLNDLMHGVDSLMDECVPDTPLNQEKALDMYHKALVLYNPANNPLLRSPISSHVSYRVNADIISGIKNQFFQQGNPMVTVEEAPLSDVRASINNCLAVVPWQAPVHLQVNVPSEEPMDADVAEGASMEIDEENQGTAVTTSCVGGDASNVLHQWPQHCMALQLRPNKSSPVTWSWG